MALNGEIYLAFLTLSLRLASTLFFQNPLHLTWKTKIKPELNFTVAYKMRGWAFVVYVT